MSLEAHTDRSLPWHEGSKGTWPGRGWTRPPRDHLKACRRGGRVLRPPRPQAKDDDVALADIWLRAVAALTLLGLLALVLELGGLL